MSVRVLQGDVRERLAAMPADAFDCVVTSPPYWGLRDYGVDGQIGLEPTLPEYLDTMVAVCRELRRVLKPSGTFFLNVGDCYIGSGPRQTGRNDTTRQTPGGRGGSFRGGVRTSLPAHAPHTTMLLKPKDLAMVPNRLAIRLQEDGWYVRSEIIWHKPNPMPESVCDRPTGSHEKLWLLTKRERYFYDADAIAVQSCNAAGRPQRRRAEELAAAAGLTEAHLDAIRAVGVTDAGKAQHTQSGFGKNDPHVAALAAEAKLVLGGYYREFLIAATVNARNVWTIATRPYKGAHFATFPPALVERCIKAGCHVGGHVLDPFGGAGTTGLVADRLGRDATLIELNPAYVEIIKTRLAEQVAA